MPKVFIIFIGIAFVIGVVFFFLYDDIMVSAPYVVSSIAGNTARVQIQTTTIRAQVADESEEQEQGLSGRDALQEGFGMLFVFDPPEQALTFWMNDMRFAIDMVWISDGTIVEIDRNVPFPLLGEDPERRTAPSGVAIGEVLEVNALTSIDWNIGDTVVIEY